MISLRTLRNGAIAVVLTLLLAVLSAFAWIQTPPGKRQLARVIERAVSDETASLELGEIEGFLPFELRLSGMTVADGDGVWLRLNDLMLDWSPLALLSGRLDVDTVRVGRVAVDRLPEGPAETEPGGSFSMPLGLRVARLEAVEIHLAEPVLGAEARLAMVGAADLAEPATGFRLSADIRRIDGAEGVLTIDLGYDPVSGHLSAEIEGAEPPGGVIARLLDLPDIPAVSVALSGDGPLENWRGDFSLDGGAGLAADAAFSIQVEEGGYRLGIDAGANLAGSWLGVGEPLLAGRSTLRGTALVDRDGAADFDEVVLGAAAGELALSGRVDWPRDTLDVTVSIQAGGADVYAALLPDIGWTGARADIRIHGPVDGARIDVTLEADDPDAAGTTLSRLSAQFSADPVSLVAVKPEVEIPFEGRGSLEGLSTGDAELDALLASAIPWSVTGEFDLDGAVAIDRLTVDGAGAAIAASGAVDADGAVDGKGALTIADLRAYQALAGLPLEGGADLSWSARSVDTGLAVDVAGLLNNARSGIAEVDVLFADAVDIRAAATIGGDGAVEIGEFEIDSGGNTVAGQIGYADGLISSDWSAILPSIAGYSELAGAPIEGRVTATGRLRGPLERLSLRSDISAEALVLEGNVVPDLAAQLLLDDLAGSLDGTVRLTATVADRPAVLAFGLALPAAGGVRFDGIAGDFAGGTVSGAVDLLPDGGIGGRLTAQADDVAPLAAFFDLPLSGMAELSADISPSGDGQRLRATLEMADAAFDGQFSAAAILADVTIEDLFGAARMEGQASALELRSGGAAFESLEIGARGYADALAVTLAVTGDRLAADAVGDLAFLEDGTRVDLKTFRALIRGEAFALAAPAVIAVSSTEVSIERLVITGAEGRASVAGTLGDTLDVSVDLTDVSLALLALVEPDLALSGHIDGEARVIGPADRPEGTFALRSSDLRSGFAGDAGLPPANMTVTGRWSQGRLALDASAGLGDGARMTVAVELPLSIDPDGAPSGLVASAEGTLDLVLFDDLLAAGGNRVAGLLTVDLRAGGTVAEPVVSGTAVLSDGNYENAFYGSRLENISAVVAASGTALRLTELTATTPGGGTLGGDGSLSLDPGKGYLLTVNVGLRNGTVVDTALATATADADLRLSGALADKLLLSGEVSILGAEFRVPDRLPVSVPDLTVEEVNVPPEIAASRPQPGPSEPAAAVDAQLDLVASATQAVYVRGRGLNVELDGNLSIKGSAAKPAIDGELGLRNGTFDIFGRRLTFERGGLDFDGTSNLDPEIDLLAAADVESVTVQVGVGGRVSAPVITLTSVPEMPQDEIAARLLFGKDVRSLTAFEAVTLAQSLGQLTGLTGGSGGILDDVRQKIGLDRLEVDVGGAGEASVSGGRYLSEGVFVGVEQGLDEQSSRVNVEIELTPNIKVESEVGADAEGRFGVNVEWDY